MEGQSRCLRAKVVLFYTMPVPSILPVSEITEFPGYWGTGCLLSYAPLWMDHTFSQRQGAQDHSNGTGSPEQRVLLPNHYSAEDQLKKTAWEACWEFPCEEQHGNVSSGAEMAGFLHLWKSRDLCLFLNFLILIWGANIPIDMFHHLRWCNMLVCVCVCTVTDNVPRQHEGLFYSLFL